MTKYITVKLTEEQNYLLNALLRGHIKDLADFNNAGKDVAFARRLLVTLAQPKEASND